MQLTLKILSGIAVLIIIVWLGSDLLIISNYFNPSLLSFITFNVACCAVVFYLTYVVQKYHVLYLQMISAGNGISNPATTGKANEKVNENISTMKAEAIKFDRINSMLSDMKAAESILLLDENTQWIEATINWHHAINEIYSQITARKITQ